MDIVLGEHQTLLQDNAARLCREFGGIRRSRAVQEAGEAIDMPAWRAMADAGWIGLLAAEAAGGLGLGGVELCLIQCEIGRHDVRVPFAATAVAAQGGCARWVPCLTGAHGLRWTGRLDGELADHVAAAEAERLLVAAEGDGGTVLVAVAVDAAGLAMRTRRRIDGSTISDLGFTAVVGKIVASGAAAERTIAQMQRLLSLAVSAELLGLGEAVMELMLTQLRTREQFGRPIGSFQALQHRSVDAYISLELLRALVFRVAGALDRGEAHPAMLAATKAKASKGVLDVVRLGLQVHGAMGYTAEHDIGLHYKRALCLAAQYGGALQHYASFAELTEA